MTLHQETLLQIKPLQGLEANKALFQTDSGHHQTRLKIDFKLQAQIKAPLLEGFKIKTQSKDKKIDLEALLKLKVHQIRLLEAELKIVLRILLHEGFLIKTL